MASIAPQIGVARPSVAVAPAHHRGAWRALLTGDGPLFIRVLRWGQRNRR